MNRYLIKVQDVLIGRTFGYIGNLVTKTIKEWLEDDSITYSAALAFYFVLSLPALLLFSVSFGSIFLKSKNILIICWSGVNNCEYIFASNIFWVFIRFMRIKIRCRLSRLMIILPIHLWNEI